ncbi:MAG: hypothetical protein Alpg2KO_17680 [Alphaproteobacteria bacterium]
MVVRAPWRLLAGLAFVCTGLALLATSNAPQIRYHSEPCFERAIHQSSDPVHLAVFGSSRMAHGFDALTYAQATEPDAAILNLSREFRGLGHIYVSLRDLSEQRRLDHVLIEYDPTAITNRNPIFPDVARWQDLIYETTTASQQSPLQNWQERAKYPLLRLTAPIRATLTRRPADQGQSTDHATDCVQFRDRTDPLQLRASRNDPFIPAQTLPDDGAIPDARDRIWLDKIIALSQQQGFTLTLLHLPELGQNPLPTRWRRAHSKASNLKWLAPRGRVLRQIKDEGYANHRHLNPKGQTLLTTWLAKQLEQ